MHKFQRVVVQQSIKRRQVFYSWRCWPMVCSFFLILRDELAQHDRHPLCLDHEPEITARPIGVMYGNASTWSPSGFPEKVGQCAGSSWSSSPYFPSWRHY